MTARSAKSKVILPAILERLGVVLAPGVPELIFDWRDLSPFTAVGFMVVNHTGGAIVATPEMSPDASHVVTVGAGKPEALTVAADGCSYDPYGVDLLAPFWRFWVSGSGSVDVYVFGIQRR